MPLRIFVSIRAAVWKCWKITINCAPTYSNWWWVLSLPRFGVHLLYHFNQLYIVYSTIRSNLLFLSVLRFMCPSVNSLYASMEDTCYFPNRKNSIFLKFLAAEYHDNQATNWKKYIVMTCLTCCKKHISCWLCYFIIDSELQLWLREVWVYSKCSYLSIKSQ